MGTIKRKVRVRAKSGKTYMRSMSVRSGTQEGSVRVHFSKHGALKPQNAARTTRAGVLITATKIGAALGGVAGVVGGAAIGATFGAGAAHRHLNNAVREANPWGSVGSMKGHNEMLAGVLRHNPKRAAAHYAGAAGRGALVGAGTGGTIGAVLGGLAGNAVGRRLVDERQRKASVQFRRTH